MKNLLKSTLYLCVFAFAGILFQISCSNSDEALSTNSTPIGKIVYYKQLGSGPSMTASICTCNYDGTNETPVNVTLPAGVLLAYGYQQSNIRLSPDGQKIFFMTINTATDYQAIYSCDITGNNAIEVKALNADGTMELGGAY